jgi:hypothetical protein
MRPVFPLTLLALTAASIAARAEEPVRINDLSGNVKARLVGARQGEGRGAWLVAKFETLGEGRREVVVVFPAHSFTTHEATLKAIVESCSDWGEAADHSQWSRVKGEAVFSLPAKGAHFAGGQGAKSLDYCYLISLKVERGR